MFILSDVLKKVQGIYSELKASSTLIDEAIKRVNLIYSHPFWSSGCSDYAPPTIKNKPLPEPPQTPNPPFRNSLLKPLQFKCRRQAQI